MNTHCYKNDHTIRAIHVMSQNSAVHAMFILLAVLLASIGVLHADGLFDFQMKLANKGNVEAEFKVGEMYEKGFGVEKNVEEGLKWITKAAEHGHETAGFKLLYYDIRKNGVNDGNKAKFDELNNKAAAGNGQAQYYVGLMYAHGVGVKQDEDTALDWLGKASLVGVTAAESEITKLRESAQRAQLQQRREAEQRMAREEAKRKEEARKQAEAKRKAEEAERQKEAEMKAKAEKARTKAAEQKSREEKERERQLAQREAEEREKEKRRQAMLEERKNKEQEQKEQFESDPCSGKSARFLSTCR
jgi:flagellar biosynthesis GTPase FlhF